MLENADIQEFKQLYEEEFGEQITDAEAQIMVSQLVRLYDALSEPLPGELPDELASMLDLAMLES